MAAHGGAAHNRRPSRRSWIALGAVCALAACAKTGTSAPASTPVPGGAVGYVRMAELVKHHPLYSQLDQYDQSIAALNLRATIPEIAHPSAAIVKEEAALGKELDAAAGRTKALLEQKSRQYQAREQQAIAQALRAAGANAPSAGAIAQQIDRNAKGQVAGVAAQARNDVQSYQKTLVAQDNAELAAAQRTLADRANRTYRAKQDDLQSKESALSLDLANKDAGQRLSLRTRLSSLALEDADRDDVRKKLADIDRKEADTLAAMKNRDGQTLAVLGNELRNRLRTEMQAKAAQIHQRSLAKLQSRASDVRSAFAGGPIAGTFPAGQPGVAANPNVPPQLRARIETLHRNYQKQFDDDAKSTIEDFNKTRDDLRRRYQQLRGVDTAAQNGAAQQVASLTKKRDDLYVQMVAQIGREVRLIAQQHGVSVVVTDPVANAGGVDLTADAMKDIESLHE